MRLAIATALLLALLPTTGAINAYGFIGTGSVTVLAAGRTACADAAEVSVLPARVRETVHFTILTDAACAPNELVLLGEEREDGWSLYDPSGYARGSLRQPGPAAIHYDLTVWVSMCPPGAICEFPTGARIEAQLIPTIIF